MALNATGTPNLHEVARTLNDGLGGQAETVDQLAEQLQGLLRQAIAQGGTSVREAKNFLNGVWLGHPLHPALTDVPIGAWWIGLFLDLMGEKDGADAAIALGTLAAVPTALAGVADWSDTEGKSRRVGLLHATLNTTALGCYVGSIFARRSGTRGVGVALSTLGTAIASVSAWLGGELVYAQGTGVSHNAWDPDVPDFQAAASADSLQEGKLTAGEITVEGQKLPITLLKRGQEVLAISGVCSHWGGPLPEGSLVEGDCVECPWHGSRFTMRDGMVVQGPATVSVPAFEARIRAGQVEVRRKRE